jgi:hypothetical protein
VTEGGNSVDCVKRYDIEHLDYMMAINCSMSVWNAGGAMDCYCIVEFESVSVPKDDIALIYQWQGGII